MDKIEGLIICLNYSDFLEHSLAENINHLDDIIVVTKDNDTATKRVCDKWSVHYVTTDCFDEYGHSFNKGQAINIGLDHLRGGENGWVLHMDADIVLPRNFRKMIRQAQIRKENIYGADRVNVYGYEAWQALKPRLDRHYQDNWFVDPGFCHSPPVPEGIKFGTRVLHREYGYVPLGFFQLWHSSYGRRYNVRRGAAQGTDIMFPIQWPRANRVLLPDVVVWHLDSELEHAKGTNWKGRKSRLFAPTPPRVSEERKQEVLRELMTTHLDGCMNLSRHNKHHHHHKPEHHHHHHCHQHGYEPCPPECHNHRHHHEGK